MLLGIYLSSKQIKPAQGDCFTVINLVLKICLNQITCHSVHSHRASRYWESGLGLRVLPATRSSTAACTVLLAAAAAAAAVFPPSDCASCRRGKRSSCCLHTAAMPGSGCGQGLGTERGLQEEVVLNTRPQMANNSKRERETHIKEYTGKQHTEGTEKRNC